MAKLPPHKAVQLQRVFTVSCAVSAVCLHHLSLLCFHKEAPDTVACRDFSRRLDALCNHAGIFCRSFWRAGAALEELKGEMLEKLLEVLSAGEVCFSVNHLRGSIC